MVEQVTDQTFDDIVSNSNIPVIVDFWATWCGPCMNFAPIFEEVSKNYSGKLKFVKVNVDDNPDVAGRFGIRSIPTLIFFKDGGPVETIVGAFSKEAFKSKIDEMLKKSSR